MKKLNIIFLAIAVGASSYIVDIQNIVIPQSHANTHTNTSVSEPTDIATVNIEDVAVPQSFGNVFISDSVNVLSDENEKRLDETLVNYYTATGNQIAVFTVQSTKGFESPKMFANALFKRLAFGEEGVDNGLLILLSLDDKRIEFETGYGLEGVLPDVTQSRIQREFMLPYFKEEEYEQGLMLGTLATIDQLDKATQAQALPPPPKPQVNPTQVDVSGMGDGNKLFLYLMIPVGLLLIFLLSMLLRMLYGYSNNSTRNRNKTKQALPKSSATKDSKIGLGAISTTKNTTQSPLPAQTENLVSCGYCMHNFKPQPLTTNTALLRLHLSTYEEKASLCRAAQVDLSECPECSFINKTVEINGFIVTCYECGSKARAQFLYESMLLANYFNVYVDKVPRTQPLQKLVFKTVFDNWQKTQTINLNVDCCFVCDDMTIRLSAISIPKKPKPISVRRSVDTSHKPYVSTATHVSMPPKATSAPNKPNKPKKTFGTLAKTKTKTRSTTSNPVSTRAKVTPKQGGKSGGGGAGSSW